jgi:hypothetical protein
LRATSRTMATFAARRACSVRVMRIARHSLSKVG